MTTARPCRVISRGNDMPMPRRRFMSMSIPGIVVPAVAQAKPEPDENSIEYRVRKYGDSLRRNIESPRWAERQTQRGMPAGFEKTPPEKISLQRCPDGVIVIRAWWTVEKGFHGACCTTCHFTPKNRDHEEYISDRRTDDAVVRLLAKEFGAGFVSVTYTDPI